jgi:hypothetical protein
MRLYAIGRPGAAPRLLIPIKDGGDVGRHCRDGECAVAAPGLGAWTISPGADAVAALLPGLDQVRAGRLADVRSEAARLIEAVAPIHRQMNALRGEAVVDFAAIDAIREVSNLAQAAIMAAETIEAIEAIGADWPE